MGFRRRATVVLAGMACSAALAGFGATGALGQGETIKLGYLGDQSGPTTTTQVPYLDGLKTYFDYLNAKGGVNGNRVELVAKDDKFSPPLAITGFRSLVNEEKVVAIVGANGSSPQLALQRDIDEAGVPVIGPQQTEAMQLNRANLWNLFPTYAGQANVAVAHARQQLGSQKLRAAVVYLNVASGISWDALIKKRVEQAGGQYLEGIATQPGATDATVAAQKLADLKPNWVFMHGGANDLINLMRGMEKLGVQGVGVTSISQAMTESVYKSTPTSVNQRLFGVSALSPAYLNTSEAKVMRAQSQKFGRPIQNAQYVYGWVVGMVTAEALKRAGATPSPASINRALATIKNFTTGGLSPNVTFGKSHLGINQPRPYRFDQATGRLLPIGSYLQWSRTAAKK